MNVSEEVNTPLMLPRSDTKIIYLDQCAISGIAKAKDELWLRMYETLKGLMQRGLIICPASQLHYEESLLSEDWWRELRAVYQTLAGLCRFCSLEDIELAQWQEAIRSHLGAADQPDGRQVVHRCEDEESPPTADLAEIRQNKAGMHRRMHRVLEPAQSFGSAILAESRRYVDQVLRDYAAGIATAVWLMGQLEAEVLRIRPDEGEPSSVVEEFLQSEIAATVPFLDIWSRLWATIAQHVQSQVVPRKLKSSDIYDVQALAYYGPYCDAMFVDNEFRKLALQRNVDVPGRYGVRLFSKSSREAFMAYLDDISADSATSSRSAS
jgi:hypothetical protein